MEHAVLDPLQIIWDYMHLNMPLQKADCIIGFGNYNEQIAVRAAELYLQDYAPKILFSGGLGRNTTGLWTQSEAERFACVAHNAGVPFKDIIIENRSTNTAENILFSRKALSAAGICSHRILGVHQPFMERRIFAALKVYWPDLDAIITSPQVTIEEYLQHSLAQGITEQAAIDVIVGDFQRIDVYAKKGYQLPQQIPAKASQAFKQLVHLGYTGQLVKP